MMNEIIITTMNDQLVYSISGVGTIQVTKNKKTDTNKESHSCKRQRAPSPVDQGVLNDVQARPERRRAAPSCSDLEQLAPVRLLQRCTSSADL